MEDIDLNLSDFMARVNSDLIGKYVNIASRSANFLTKKFDGQLSGVSVAGNEIVRHFFESSEDIADAYKSRQYGKGVREIMSLADRANSYIDTHKPWELAKSESDREKLHEVCSVALNLFKLLTVYLKPVLPALAESVEKLYFTVVRVAEGGLMRRLDVSSTFGNISTCLFSFSFASTLFLHRYSVTGEWCEPAKSDDKAIATYY